MIGVPAVPHSILSLREVVAYRGDTRVFDGLSLEVAARESVAIVGPNGAGKSTLLKLLAGEIHPVVREGSWLRLFGRDRWNVWELREHLGIVSNDLQAAYEGNVCGIDVVLSGYRSSVGTWHQDFTAAERRRAERVLEELGVGDLAARRFAEMSTGQQRRLLLGRALVHDPDTLVLDEPTGGLDLKACFQYLATVRRLMREGKTVVLVTHHIHEIPPEIARVVLLQSGAVVADAEKRTALTSERLSDLFGIAVEVVERNGFYQAMPGT
jgi:iron complex transport system ATP-binding protein